MKIKILFLDPVIELVANKNYFEHSGNEWLLTLSPFLKSTLSGIFDKKLVPPHM